MKQIKESVNHTPGPWSYQRTRFSFLVEAGDKNDMIENPPRDICMVADESSVLQGITPEMEANARLIAAAPDLLEACKVALCNFQHSNDTNSMEGWRVHTFDVLRNAIVKATEEIK